jgi:F0F1-type ATP synthase membrane subunit c/vacuolar-type H+-ATPase subunit K
LELDAHTWELIGRYLGAGFALGFGGIGAAIGMGMAAGSANIAMMKQPEVSGGVLRTMLISQAVGGSPSIFALVIGLLILFLPQSGSMSGMLLASAMIGAGVSTGLGCLGSGWGCGYPAAAACEGVARNPRKSVGLTSTMIVSQAVTQSPSIFAAVISLILLFVPLSVEGIAGVGIALGAGLAMGASAFGPGIGCGLTAGGAIEGLGAWPKSQGVTFRNMLIGQAVCQTPAIFGMLIAFIMIFTLRDLEMNIIGFAKAMGAGVAVGFGGVGPGIGAGMVGETTALATAIKPQHESLFMRTMLIGQAVSQSTAIYALIIALLLLYIRL